MFEPSFLKPEKVLSQLKIKDNMIAADFGSGAGGWAIPLAKRLEEGKVYAVDVQQEMLSALISQASLENVLNIETIHYDLEHPDGIDLIDNFFDIVIMTNLLFQLENKEGVIKEASRLLKKGGQLLVVDWKKSSKLGPKQGKVSKGDVEYIAKEADFKLEKEFDAGDHHFAQVFTRL